MEGRYQYLYTTSACTPGKTTPYDWAWKHEYLKFGIIVFFHSIASNTPQRQKEANNILSKNITLQSSG